MLSATCHMEKMATRLRSGTHVTCVYDLLVLLQKHKKCQDLLTRNGYSVLEKIRKKFMQKAAEKKIPKSAPFSSFSKRFYKVFF
jgi:hypothetical protein